MQVVIVGGGIVGTAHALEAVRRGHSVTQLERRVEPRGATPRALGLIRVSACAEGDLAATAEARMLWEELGGKVPGIGFRATGSITLLRTPGELAVATEVATRGDYRFELLDPTVVRTVNPAVRGPFTAGLYCSDDAVVDPRYALPALRSYLTATTAYTYLDSTAAITLDTAASNPVVGDDHGRIHPADLVLVCPGAENTDLVRDLVGDLRIRPVRATLLATAPLDEPFPTAIADGDSVRQHPVYRGEALDMLQHNESRRFDAATHDVDLVCVPRLDGGLTIGCAYDRRRPPDFGVDEDATTYLVDTVEALLGRSLPPVVRRWSGAFSEPSDGSRVVRRQVGEHTWVVTGAGSSGLTMAPYLAHETAELAGL